ncbi:hypothetical protein [Actinomyces sp. 565]|uniref:hypothetical protein n=1 Tax=Actinomyces sp. 565 TaxID=2057794 RepID=UPI0013A68D23|nr:hypothetical protein [Actinomyces sp. 565]NDR53029.1 hypothetical protein [Actinomyces sp. 565]
MSHTPRKTLGVIGLVAAAALAVSACQSEPETTAQSPDQQVTTESGGDSTDEPLTDTATDSASEPTAEITVPDGYTLTEVPDADLSLALPADWSTVAGDASDTSQADAVAEIANVTGWDEEQVIDSLRGMDLFSMDTSGDTRYNPNLSVVIYNDQYTRPTEDDMHTRLEHDITSSDLTATPVNYTAPSTASGQEAAVQTYVITGEDSSRTEGAYVAVPANRGDSMAVITISASTAEHTQELIDAILDSI